MKPARVWRVSAEWVQFNNYFSWSFLSHACKQLLFPTGWWRRHLQGVYLEALAWERRVRLIFFFSSYSAPWCWLCAIAHGKIWIDDVKEWEREQKTCCQIWEHGPSFSFSLSLLASFSLSLSPPPPPLSHTICFCSNVEGKPAETVGQDAADRLLDSVRLGVCADEHLQDQVIRSNELPIVVFTVHQSHATLHLDLLSV